jgi:hypothetical protein
MHEIKTPVGEDNALLVPARPLEQGNQLRDGHDFLKHPSSYLRMQIERQ